MQWANHDSGISDAMEFFSRPRGKPFRFKIATLAGAQVAHWAVEFGFEVIGTCIRIAAQRWGAVSVQSNLRTVSPKDHRCFAGIRLAGLVLKALHHGVSAVAIDHGQPAVR